MKPGINHKAVIFTACVCLLVLPFGAFAADDEISVNAKTEDQQSAAKNTGSASEAKPCAGVNTSKGAAVVFPAPLIRKMGIDPSDIIGNQSAFTNDTAHIEWMNHVHDVLPEISSGKKETLIRIHTSLLYIKDKLNDAYFNGKINKQEFTTRLAELIQWFQESNRCALSAAEYNALLGIPDQEDDKPEPLAAKDSDSKLGFPIPNPAATDEMIRKKFNEATIKELTHFYQSRSQELKEIREFYKTNDFRKVEAKQVKKDMQRIEKELAEAFASHCRSKLSDEQFKLLFGNAANK